MQEIFDLFQYIKNKYDGREMTYSDAEIVVKFHEGFEMKIRLQGFYHIYFNDIFYYAVDGQDIKDTIDDFFGDRYVFCARGRKIKIVDRKDFSEDIKCDHAWTIDKTLK